MAGVKIKIMLKKELEELFEGMSPFVKNRLKPVMVILLERAEDLDAGGLEAEDYEDELESITKEVNKIKYIEDQWRIMNADRDN